MVDRPVAQLIEVGGHPFPVLASPGTEAAAVAAASRCEHAHRYLTGLLGTSPRIRVLVLAEGDWGRHATFPLYGMPHYTDERTLVIAGEETDFWQAVVPADDALTPAARQQLRAIYGTRDDALRLSRFFDLLAVHELAHLFHLQAGREFPRLWLMELFCNLCLHAYTARTEPNSLPALETFPAAVVASGHEGLVHHTLEDFERLYVEVGPVNYGWYQSQLHAAAKRAFDNGGEDVARRFWDLVPLVASDAPVGELTAALGRVHPEVARTLTAWPPAAPNSHTCSTRRAYIGPAASRHPTVTAKSRPDHGSRTPGGEIPGTPPRPSRRGPQITSANTDEEAADGHQRDHDQL